MNILFISPNSPLESIGGIERYLINLMDYFQNKKDFSTIIALPVSGKSYCEKRGNITIYFDENLNLASALGGQKEVSNKAHLFSKEIENIIKKHNVEIICAENFHLGLPPAYSLLLNMVAGLNNIPLVLRLHSFAITDLQVELINQLMWKRISCVSKSLTGDCFHKGTDIDILTTDYLGVNTSTFNDHVRSSQIKKELNLSSEHKIILTATRIILGRKNILREKGLINLIQAFSKISPRYPNLRLLISVGKPPARLKNEFNQAHKMLMGYIKLHNIESKTIVKTFRLDEMPQVYRESDVFVLPSENETFGQVFIEAMASGLPVLGTKVGGIPEIISDSYNGYLVPPDDSSVLSQRIEKLINDKTTRGKFIKAGIKTVEDKFALEKQFFSFSKMLEETVSASV